MAKSSIRVAGHSTRFPGQLKTLPDLYYNRHRDYDPTIGRYIQADPIGLAGGDNPYLCANGKPVSYIVPDGQFAWLIPPAIGALGYLGHRLWELGGAVECLTLGDVGDAAMFGSNFAGLGGGGVVSGGLRGLGGRLGSFGRRLGRDTTGSVSAQRAGNAAERAVPQIGYTRGQLQHAFKHAGDFGIPGNPNHRTLANFSSAIQNHISAPGTQAIQGTYRGQAGTHFIDPNTGLNVIRDSSGKFLSGWKLSPKQLEYVTTTGKLGGGR